MEKQPLRSCVVCKAPAAQSELIRFVLRKAELTGQAEKGEWVLALDARKVLDGRGAYCHLREQCLFAPNFGESLIRSLLCRGKRTLEGEARREPFAAVFERAKEQVEGSLRGKRRLAPRIMEVMKRLGELVQSEQEPAKRSTKSPKRKIRI